MNFFKPKDLNIYSPLSGQVIPLSAVQDEMFSQAMMGPGTAVIPAAGTIVAPFDGQVKFIFPTKHALGLVSAAGVELLIHIGIDTVNLEGKPFTLLVNDHQKIKKGQPLVNFDLEMLKALQVDPTVILVLTAAAAYSIDVTDQQPISAGEPLILITKKQ